MNVNRQRKFALDRENVASLLAQLSNTQISEHPQRNQASNLGADFSLSKYATYFAEQIRSTPYSCLFEVRLPKLLRADRVLTVHSMLFCNRWTQTVEPGTSFPTIWIQLCSGVFRHSKISDSWLYPFRHFTLPSFQTPGTYASRSSIRSRNI